jgi:tetratricopeptide (TPR) repeat protein
MDAFWERWQNHEVDVALALLQIGSFAATFALLIVCMLVYRYETDAALMPIWDFISSIKVAVPPIIILSISYLYAFLTGDSVADAPKNMWAMLRDRALQQKHVMVAFISLTICICLTTGWVVYTRSPPSYVRLVGQLLGGENDDQQVILESIKNIKEKNPKFSEQLEIVRRVFDERRQWNHENKPVNSTLPRIFIRALEANIDDHAWIRHPLRLHADAEAHSMLAQALSISHDKASLEMVKENRDSAIRLYNEVINSKSTWVTPLLRRSAEQNIGNAYFYAGSFDMAIAAYSKLSETEKNIATDGNRVAALINLGQTKEAVAVGDKAINESKSSPEVLTELRSYVSLVTNTGFGKLILQDGEGARNLMQEAFDLLPDALARQNLALALDMVGESESALNLLAEDSDAPIVTAASEFDVVAKRGGGNCTYLIRTVALSHLKRDHAEIAANLAAYSRQAQPNDLLATNYGGWQQLGLKTLKNEVRPCGGLIFLQNVKAALQ